MTDAEPQSPCVKLCQIDEAGRACTGCGRTLEEIAAWSRMGRTQKRALLEELKARQAGKTRAA